MALYNQIITIETPFGPMQADLDDIKDAITHVSQGLTLLDQEQQSMQSYIGCNLEQKRKDYGSRSYIGWAHAIDVVIERDWNISRVTNFHHGTVEKPPTYLEEKVMISGRMETVKIPHQATVFMEEKNGGEDPHRMCIRYMSYDTYEVDVLFAFQTGFDFAAFWQEVEEEYYQRGIYKGAKISADFRFLELPELNFNDVVLTEDQKLFLNRNILKYVENLHVYRKNGLPSSRGILLTGPPGTGKTLTCNVIIQDLDITVIYVSRNAINDTGQISELYDLARKLAPALVIIEDIDTLGGIDREEVDHPLLGEFLNCLAGVEENHGVITLATTNYPQNLDWALTDRPGRFDVRIDFGYPNEKVREKILLKYLDPLQTKGIKVKDIAKKTEGFSGAYLREIVQQAFISAFEGHNYDADKVVVTHSNLLDSLKEMEKQKATVNKENRIAAPEVSEQLYG